MKKTGAMLVMLISAVLFAGEEENVKAVVVKDWQLAAQGKFAECLALRAPDCTDTNDGQTADYEQIKWQIISLDGKHPEEFLLFLATMKFQGAKIPAETRAVIREEARKPEFISHYETACSQFASKIRKDAAFQLKTLKITSVKVDGNSAVVTAEYEREGSTMPRLQTISLRKIEGTWKISRIVDEMKEKRKQQ